MTDFPALIMLASVVICTEVMNDWPSPNPDGSQLAFRKNSNVNVVLGGPLKVLCAVLLPPEVNTAVVLGAV